jgi:hypothetical protein
MATSHHFHHHEQLEFFATWSSMPIFQGGGGGEGGWSHHIFSKFLSKNLALSLSCMSLFEKAQSLRIVMVRKKPPCRA